MYIMLDHSYPVVLREHMHRLTNDVSTNNRGRSQLATWLLVYKGAVWLIVPVTQCLSQRQMQIRASLFSNPQELRILLTAILVDVLTTVSHLCSDDLWYIGDNAKSLVHYRKIILTGSCIISVHNQTVHYPAFYTSNIDLSLYYLTIWD